MELLDGAPVLPPGHVARAGIVRHRAVSVNREDAVAGELPCEAVAAGAGCDVLGLALGVPDVVVLRPLLGIRAAGDGEGHFRLLGEVVAGAAADPGDAVWEIEVRERAAVREGIPADAGDAGGELHRGEAGAAVEGVHAHGGELAALGEDDLLEVGAVVDRPVGQARHAGRDVELLDGAFKSRPRYYRFTIVGIHIARADKFHHTVFAKNEINLISRTSCCQDIAIRAGLEITALERTDSTVNRIVTVIGIAIVVGEIELVAKPYRTLYQLTRHKAHRLARLLLLDKTVVLFIGRINFVAALGAYQLLRVLVIDIVVLIVGTSL